MIMSQQYAGTKCSIPRFLSTLIRSLLLALAGAALADPPGRVARIGYVSGAVSLSGGEDDWVAATFNRPLVAGDQLWSDNGARAELQIGIATIRLGAQTSATLLNLDDRVAQFQLVQGTLTVRVRRLDRDQVIEIDTPNLAYVIRRVGQYRDQRGRRCHHRLAPATARDRFTATAAPGWSKRAGHTVFTAPTCVTTKTCRARRRTNSSLELSRPQLRQLGLGALCFA